MTDPSSVAVEEPPDGKPQVWVVENSMSPRRVSVWASARALLDGPGRRRVPAWVRCRPGQRPGLTWRRPGKPGLRPGLHAVPPYLAAYLGRRAALSGASEWR
jgi:hypothetical protein